MAAKNAITVSWKQFLLNEKPFPYAGCSATGSGRMPGSMVMVPPHQSQLLYNALKKTGADATLHWLKGAGHDGPAFDEPGIKEMVLKFFVKYLDKEQ